MTSTTVSGSASRPRCSGSAAWPRRSAALHRQPDKTQQHMANTPFKVGALNSVYRWRYKDGGGSQDIRYMPVSANKTIRKGDVVMYTTGSTGSVERYITPSATSVTIANFSIGDSRG